AKGKAQATPSNPQFPAPQGESSPGAKKKPAAPAANPSPRRCRASCRKISSTRRTLAAGFLYREPEISPAAPFVMRSALHIAAASLFFVRVRLGDEFRERSVHLHVVRHEQAAVAQARPELAKFPEHVLIAMRAVVQEHVDRPG